MTAPSFRRLVAGFPQCRPEFDPESDHVEFVVDKVAIRQVFSEYFGFLYPYLVMIIIYHLRLVK
jgi:hypothetical protein